MDDIKFDQIMKRLDAIEEKINRIDSKSAQMTQHISFVQSVYATLRSPLNYLTSYVTREPSQLPSPEDLQDCARCHSRPSTFLFSRVFVRCPPIQWHLKCFDDLALRAKTINPNAKVAKAKASTQ